MIEVNAQGHIVTSSGVTTMPETRSYYVGSAVCFITFAYLVMHDGRVALHSALHDEGEIMPKEDFLYEVVDRIEAMSAAETMVDDAIDFLESAGVSLDDNPSPADFLNRLQAELKNRLH